MKPSTQQRVGREKYTYDSYQLFADYRGYSAGTGINSRNLPILKKIHNKSVKKYPKDIHILIRRPDNKIIAFHHPYKHFQLV